MIVYHAISYYQTLACLVHSCHQKDDIKVLLMGNSIKFNMNTNELSKFFQKVIYIDIRAGLGDLNKYQKGVTDYFEKIFSENGFTISDETKIYAGGCHYNFGVYLAINHIPFYYMEEACGLLSQADHVRNIDRNNRKEVDVVDGLGLYDGTNENIIGIICNLTAQKEDCSYDKGMHFDVLQEMNYLNDDTIKDMIHVFGNVDEIRIPANSVIFLSQHYANLNMMSYERQALLYGLIFDYFLENKNIIIKKHPADHMAYNAVYPGVQEIKEKFLSEFIPFIMRPMPAMIATISSTGIIPLKSVSAEQLIFDFDFENVFESIHRVYTAFGIASAMGENITVACAGINKRLADNLIKYAHFNIRNLKFITEAEEGTEEDTVLVIDDVTDMDFFEERYHAKAMIFINSRQDYIFYSSTDKKIWKDIVPVEIQKKNLNPNRDYEMYNDFETEKIYVITKDGEVRQTVMDYTQKKELEHLQMEIDVTGYDSEESLRIAILEGMLEAAEKRLLYYIDVCSQQKQQIEELRK